MQAGREIKFRAWVSKFGRSWMETCIDVNPFYIGDGDRYRWKREEVALMQFTGLRYKNGKEIYEGDVVKDKHGAIGEVKFHKTWGSFFFAKVFGHNEDGELVRSNSAVPMWNDWSTLEIIGNIYENPERTTTGNLT